MNTDALKTLTTTLTAQAVPVDDASTAREPQVVLLSNGQIVTTPFSAVLEQLAAALKPTDAAAPAAPLGLLKGMKHHKVEEAVDGAYTLKVDEVPTHFVYSKKGASVLKLVTAATDGFLEVPVWIWGPEQVSIPDITEWHTPKPKAGERGWLVATLHFYTRKPVWSGLWAPVL